MKRLFRLATLLVLMAAMTLPGGAFAKGLSQTSSPRTYTVLVGYENTHQAVDVMGFFPNVVTIHVGDTVHWKLNSKEIHTVTFNADFSQPLIINGADPNISPIMFNPYATDQVVPTGGMSDVNAFANSGIMGYDSGEVQNFSLTFSKAGTYNYLCLIHGEMMSGQVVVVGPDQNVPTPAQEMAMGKQQIASQLAKVPAVIKAANAQVKPAEKNPDGTMTHYILLGYESGQIDLMRFFPNKTNVKPGDTVVWEMSPSNGAPHTVTFLNGAPSPDLVTFVSPFLYINPEIVFPSPFPPQPGEVLTRSGVYSSGLAQPIPGEFYSLKIGNMTPGLLPYECLLHDESGMTGTLVVLP
jgi:plastocyanin